MLHFSAFEGTKYQTNTSYNFFKNDFSSIQCKVTRSRKCSGRSRGLRGTCPLSPWKKKSYTFSINRIQENMALIVCPPPPPPLRRENPIMLHFVIKYVLSLFTYVFFRGGGGAAVPNWGDCVTHNIDEYVLSGKVFIKNQVLTKKNEFNKYS